MFEEGFGGEARECGKEAGLDGLVQGRQGGAEEGSVVEAHASCGGGLSDGAVDG